MWKDRLDQADKACCNQDKTRFIGEITLIGAVEKFRSSLADSSLSEADRDTSLAFLQRWKDRLDQAYETRNENEELFNRKMKLINALEDFWPFLTESHRSQTEDANLQDMRSGTFQMWKECLDQADKACNENEELFNRKMELINVLKRFYRSLTDPHRSQAKDANLQDIHSGTLQMWKKRLDQAGKACNQGKKSFNSEMELIEVLESFYRSLTNSYYSQEESTSQWEKLQKMLNELDPGQQDYLTKLKCIKEEIE